MAGKGVDTIMSPTPSTVRAGALLMEAAFGMTQAGERRLLVTRDDRVVGLIREWS